MKEFPIMDVDGDIARWIPWGLIEPHEKQALSNHDQTLKRLAERGGLSPSEAIAVLENRRWHSMNYLDAVQKLSQLVFEYNNGRR